MEDFRETQQFSKLCFKWVHITTFTIFRSGVEGFLAGQRRPRQWVDLIVVSAEAVNHLAFLAHINQDDHPIFVPVTAQLLTSEHPISICLKLCFQMNRTTKCFEPSALWRGLHFNLAVWLVDGVSSDMIFPQTDITCVHLFFKFKRTNKTKSKLWLSFLYKNY